MRQNICSADTSDGIRYQTLVSVVTIALLAVWITCEVCGLLALARSAGYWHLRGLRVTGAFVGLNVRGFLVGFARGDFVGFFGQF